MKRHTILGAIALASQVFDGSLPISRSAFKIGEGDWSDPAIVADAVTITFRLTADK